MTANPVELISGLATTDNVSKVDIVAWAKARVPQVVANATEVRNTNLALQIVIFIKTLGQSWFLDTSDTTTADDGINCIISLDGFRYKPLSAVPTPSLTSLGGVFSSDAVTHQYLTGLDTAGNLTRSQPSAADLSDGNTGTGTVAHANGATLTGASVTGLTALGIRSTGAAFDLTIASSEVLTAGRTLSLVVGDANRTISLAGNVTLAGALTTAGAFGSTFTMTGTTAVTFPTTGTLATLAGTETLTNKSINAANNTITNLTTAMFASNVVDTDGTLSANSDTRLASQKAVKTYVDTVAQGLDPKASVLVATTANITLSGEQTIDGQLTSASRVLVKNQSTQANNGIYISASGSWTRAADFDAWTEIPGAYVFVEKGTTFGDCGFVCTSDAGGTLGTTAVTFVQFAGAGTYTAGTGLTLTGTAFAIDSTVATLTGAQALTNKTYNGLTVSSSTGTLTIANGKTASISNTLTLTGTDSSSVAFGSGGTVAYVANKLSVFAATSSSELAGVISDETGSGALVFAAGATMTGGTHTGLTGLALRDTSAAFDVSLAAVSSATLTAGRTLTLDMGNVAHTLQFGTTANTITFPSVASDTVVMLAAAQTVTNKTIDTASNTFKLNGVAFGTATQATAALNAMVGDSGSGGTKGLVPAPASGDAAAGKYLAADGTYSIPPGGSGLAAATKAQQQTGTSNVVGATPLHQQDHDSAAKAWVIFTGSASNGTQTIKASYNVSSVSRTATGQYTVTFTTAFATANYVGMGAVNGSVTDGHVEMGTLATGTAAVLFIKAGGTVTTFDPAQDAYLVFYGRQ